MCYIGYHKKKVPRNQSRCPPGNFTPRESFGPKTRVETASGLHTGTRSHTVRDSVTNEQRPVFFYSVPSSRPSGDSGPHYTSRPQFSPSTFPISDHSKVYPSLLVVHREGVLILERKVKSERDVDQVITSGHSTGEVLYILT